MRRWLGVALLGAVVVVVLLVLDDVLAGEVDGGAESAVGAVITVGVLAGLVAVVVGAVGVGVVLVRRPGGQRPRRDG